jgi:hypothetical protein
MGHNAFSLSNAMIIAFSSHWYRIETTFENDSLTTYNFLPIAGSKVQSLEPQDVVVVRDADKFLIIYQLLNLSNKIYRL